MQLLIGAGVETNERYSFQLETLCAAVLPLLVQITVMNTHHTLYYFSVLSLNEGCGSIFNFFSPST